MPAAGGPRRQCAALLVAALHLQLPAAAGTVEKLELMRVFDETYLEHPFRAAGRCSVIPHLRRHRAALTFRGQVGAVGSESLGMGSCGRSNATSTRRGRLNQNTVPSDSAERAPIVPPCAWTSSLEM